MKHASGGARIVTGDNPSAAEPGIGGRALPPAPHHTGDATDLERSRISSSAGATTRFRKLRPIVELQCSGTTLGVLEPSLVRSRRERRSGLELRSILGQEVSFGDKLVHGSVIFFGVFGLPAGVSLFDR
jgi:hypothetical protein